MKTFAAALLVFGFSTFAQADDGCIFNFDGFRSPLDGQHYTVKRASPVVRDEVKKVLRQDVTLDNGVKVEFSGGGCAHVGYSFTYSGFNQKPKNLDELVYLSLSLMVETPTVQTDHLKDGWMRNLTISRRSKIVESSKGVYDVPCGDANCSLDTSVRGKISVTYDFAL